MFRNKPEEGSVIWINILLVELEHAYDSSSGFCDSG